MDVRNHIIAFQGLLIVAFIAFFSWCERPCKIKDQVVLHSDTNYLPADTTPRAFAPLADSQLRPSVVTPPDSSTVASLACNCDSLLHLLHTENEYLTMQETDSFRLASTHRVKGNMLTYFAPVVSARFPCSQVVNQRIEYVQEASEGWRYFVGLTGHRSDVWLIGPSVSVDFNRQWLAGAHLQLGTEGRTALGLHVHRRIKL